MALVYKFAELSMVTDESLEACVNEWVARGWSLEAIHFAMRESSRRPAMAFIAFLTSPRGQTLIGEFRGKAGRPLFEPLAGVAGVDLVK